MKYDDTELTWRTVEERVVYENKYIHEFGALLFSALGDYSSLLLAGIQG